VDGVSYLLVTYQLAAFGQSARGSPIADASEHRDAIIAAPDLLMTGI
jgi:hypothetical protein